LSVEETIKMEEELSAIENALHDLFNKNIEKLKDPNVISSIFSIDNFPGFIKANSGVLTDTSTDIDDASFYWYVASIASLKPSDFYYNYKNIVQGRKIAPIRS
jgi:hypothetical protein